MVHELGHILGMSHEQQRPDGPEVFYGTLSENISQCERLNLMFDILLSCRSGPIVFGFNTLFGTFRLWFKDSPRESR